MRPSLPMLIATALIAAAPPARANEHIVCLGDSLSFAYEAEFGFRVTIQFSGTYGDGFGPEVRNWIEILNDPAYRKPSFDIGARDTISLLTSFFPPQTTELLFRHEYNWAIPGLKVDQLRRFLDGSASILELLGENPSFDSLLSALKLSDFDESDFALTDLESQIQSSATRLTLFIGGNDINGAYGTIYNGGSGQAFVDEFVDDATWCLDRVLTLNPDIQVVLVNVPHVGITPDVQSTYPTDPVGTGRVTAVLRELNARLAALAASRGVGYADIFTTTLSLLDPAPWGIHGIPFFNSGSTTGDLEYIWLNGSMSANFHPNTNAQALLANVIIDAFNETYHSGIAPLSATEILGGLLAKTPGEIDMPFADWMAGFRLAGQPENDDSDTDGLPAGLEFALGLNPTLHDAKKLHRSLTDAGGSPALELAYPIRLPASAHYALSPASGPTPEHLTPFPTPPTTDPDGLARARLPFDSPRGFLRLEATLTESGGGG